MEASRDLLNYIRSTKRQGFSDNEIRDALLNAGWRMNDIKDAFDCLKEADSAKVVIKQTFSIKKNMLGAAITVFVFFFTASAAFGGYYYYNTIPARTLEKIQEKAEEIKSFKFEANLLFSAKDMDISVNSSGSADMSDKTSPISYSKHDVDFYSPDMKISASAEIKNIKNKDYLRLNVPFEKNDASLGSMIEMAGIQNKWIKIDPKEIEAILSEKMDMLKPIDEDNKKNKNSEILFPKTSWNSYLAASLFGIAAAETQPEQSAEKSEKLADMIKKYKLFKVSEYAGKEAIGNIQTRHIKFELDKNELFRLILDRYQGKQDDLGKYQQEIEEIIECIKSMSGDVWAGKDDGYLYRAAISVLIADEELGDSELKFAIEFSDFNKPVSAEEPEEAESVLDVLERIGFYQK